MADIDRKEIRTLDRSSSAPSWQDYLDALRVEGRRYRPASLSKTLEDSGREPAGKQEHVHSGRGAQPASDDIAETGRAATVCRRGTEATVRARK